MVSLSGVCVLMTRPVTPNGTQYGIFIVVCGILTGCGSVSFVQGVILSNQADAVSLYFSLPIIVIILEAFIKCKRVKILHLSFTTCSFVGVAVVSQPFTTLKEQSYLNILGMILGLAAGIFHACGFMIVQKLKEVTVHPLILCLATSSTMFAVSLSLGTFLQRLAIPRSFDEILILSAVGFLHFTANAFAFLAVGIERPYVVSVIMTFEVIFTFIAQWIFLNVTPSWYSATGGFLISAVCIGVALSKDEETSSDDREEQRLVNE
ncbi:hypothetical protein HOLleu_22745 [Holothuria leucospilota]|uniref:EamA domain-containing protein n=1 Tax=Holothuria leucospilota TaxID=206669 RepID=A0A9Q1BZV0_HOLLE|nr:hypothetical protein HOLleu_22745 [Holothuria leucospilota]